MPGDDWAAQHRLSEALISLSTKRCYKDIIHPALEHQLFGMGGLKDGARHDGVDADTVAAVMRRRRAVQAHDRALRGRTQQARMAALQAVVPAGRRIYQLPYLPTNPRQTALRSAAKGSSPTLAFFAAAVITITSLSSGSTKIDWP
jgi:hypothetical protein